MRDTLTKVSARWADITRQILPATGRVLAASILIAAPMTAAAAQALAPHTALYEIKLLSARSGSGIEAVSGDMAIRWEAACSGWTMTNRTVLDVSYTGGENVRIAMDASTWEAAAGDRYTFLIRTLFDDKETERIEGKARLDGAESHADFVLPEKKRIPLPDGTIFPTAHTKMVLGVAGDTPQIVRAIVFDGFTFTGAHFVNAIVGKTRPPSKTSAAGQAGLGQLPYWTINLAFFDDGKAEAEPGSEIRLNVFRNGIVSLMDMDFGDFRVRADLKELKIEPSPDCS